ncbi:UDP pyrophosphate phosphatase [Marinobacter nauticus]|uniref:UDP pyrophosphate phosphatase n=1 Tax=Marinobacter nauticus TaxID=2743 RepID=UPI001C98D363|nr:UDP pyrophosphate phosphatase [Marinobacter nauticus]MBY6220747.1 UDP pyrophosphate phosphatase [Marinobacter nauticus]
MIGGINPSNPSLYQAGNNSPARERTDVSRTPAADPQALATGDVRNQLNTAPGNPAQPGGTGPELDSRRVEARRAAEDARLERFRADELPLPAARALSAFAGVAAAGQEFESGSVLSGIDILV